MPVNIVHQSVSSTTERLKGIVPFVCAADAGSFSAAAQQLNLSSSAVSKSISRLERRLGVVLFERTTRSLALTDAGRAFYETCTRILGELSEAEATLSAQKREPVGAVRVAMPASFGRLCVVPVLVRFATLYSDVRPLLSFSDRFVDLIDEGIDIAVRIGGPLDLPASLMRRYLGRERLIFCAAPSWLERNGAPASADELLKCDCIAYAKPDGSLTPWTFATADGQTGQRAVHPRVVAGDAEAQLAFVRAGVGAAQLATWLVREDLETGRLIEILPEAATEGLPLSLIWPVARQLTPKVNMVAQTLETHLRIR